MLFGKSKMSNFSRGLCFGVLVLLSQGMPLRARALRFMRAKGEGVAEIRVSGSIVVDMVAGEFWMMRERRVLVFAFSYFSSLARECWPTLN